MISQTLNIRKLSRGLTQATLASRETEAAKPAAKDTFELSPVEHDSQEKLQDLDEITKAVNTSFSGRRSNFSATVTANLVGGISGAALLRELAIVNDQSLLEIDFKKKPSAASIRKNIQSADWVVVKNFDQAGKSHEAELMRWQLEKDGRMDTKQGNYDRIVISSDEDSVVVHGWEPSTDSRWARFARNGRAPEKNNTFFPERVDRCEFRLSSSDWKAFKGSGLSYERWADQRMASLDGKDWAYTRKLEAQKSIAPGS